MVEELTTVEICSTIVLVRSTKGNEMATRVQIRPSYEWSKEAMKLGISHRELEVFALVLEGFSNKQAAEILEIKHQSVKNHMYSLSKKLRVKNVGQGLIVAIHLNLVSVEERAGDLRMSYDEAAMVEIFRQIVEGVTQVPDMKQKDRIAIRAFLLAHGIDIYGEKHRLESEGGSSEVKR